MPCVVRDPETAHAPPIGNVAGGFWCDCLPFASAATFTIAVTTLDLITDWLLYRTFHDIHFTERLQGALAQPGFNVTQPMVWRNRGVYLHLPLLLQVFCLLGAVVYVFDLLWMSWMFTTERRKFKNKRDGLVHKPSLVEKHGRDMFILLHVSLHDLPIPALLLAAQLAISCRLVLHLGHVIFYIAMLTTMVSVLWKLLQVVHNSGCFGRCEEFHCTPGSWVMRASSVVLLLGALAVAALNVVLLNGWRDVGNNNLTTAVSEQMMNKIHIDSWLRDDGVFLAIDLPPMNAPESAQLVSDGSTNSNNFPESPVVVRVMAMAQLFAVPQQTLMVDLQCDGPGHYPALVLWSGSPEVNTMNCSVVFALKVSPPEGVLYYDFYIQYTTPNGACSYSHSQSMVPYTSSSYPAGLSATRPSHLVEEKIIKVAKGSNSMSSPPPAGSTSSLIGLTTHSPPEGGTNTEGVVLSAEDVSMATQISDNVRMFISRSSQIKCPYSIMRNTSLSLGNPCSVSS